MARNQLAFYAVGGDLKELLRETANVIPFEVVCVDVEGDEHWRVLASDINTDLSSAKYGDQNREPAYLLVRPGVQLGVRDVEQRGNVTRRILDQKSHPESVYIRPGGRYGDDIIAGQLGTISDNSWSLNLCHTLIEAIKKNFVKIGSYYVGEEAVAVLDGGGRLTTNVRAPVEYDLCR